MKVLKIIGIILLVLIALFLVIAIFLPSKATMESSIVINKPASLIYKQVNNFKNWAPWSPFQAADPQMVNTYEGPEQGIDATMRWTSPKNGNGYMTIIESVPYQRVVSTLDFGMPGTTNTFLLKEEQGGTKITWRVDIDKLPYPMGRYIGMMITKSMPMVFDQGLVKLKEVTEAMPDPPALQVTEFQERMVLSVLDSCNWSDIGGKMGQMFGEIMEVMTKTKCQQVGAPLSMYHKWDEVAQFTVFENCVPIDKEVGGKGRVQFKVIPAKKAVMGTHYGSYESTMYMYMAMDEYIRDFGLEQVGGPIEEYVTDPMSEPDTSKWQTNIYFPVK